MSAGRTQQIEGLLLDLLPADGTMIGNAALFARAQASAKAAGLPCTERIFADACEALVAAGVVIKGRGRGGSTGRVPQAQDANPAMPYSAAFSLEAQVVPAGLPFDPPRPATAARRNAPAAPGDPQVLSYRHPDKRKNNPEVGLVSEESDPEQPKTTWGYDPHLDPVLEFDSARARTESLIDGALASYAESGDASAMRAALEELKRQSAPYLQWTGKAERTSFDIDTVSLHVHERVDPMSILAAVSRAASDKSGRNKARGGIQPGLFEAPFESLAVKIVDDRGIESLKVMALMPAEG